MTKITVTDTDGDSNRIIVIGSQTPERALEAHGYDPESVDWVVEKGVSERIEQLEEGTGVGGKGKNGIAHRIDDLEQRISDLEEAQ